MTQLQGRTALVTGAASGIGTAIVERFRQAGARVAGIDIHSKFVADYVTVADLRSDEQVDIAFQAVVASIGAPDIVVHAAAATFHGGVFTTEPDIWLDLYNVNVAGAVRLLQLAAPAMRENGRGSFVVLSSINADFATPTLAAYAATKAALNNLVQTAAVELAPHGIRINAIAPASIDTPAMRASYDRQPNPAAAREANVKRHPLARLGEAAEVAELALFLASDQAGWITGSVYPIDGGARVARQ